MTDIKGSTSTIIDIRVPLKELDEVLCPICMEHPHNAVLILCSSHHKGCRSYVCDTSYRHSNCLDRFKKLTLDTRISEQNSGFEAYEPNLTNSNLKCPMCRGAVHGWKISKEARQYLDSKRRSCSRESCSFSGNYSDLRRHARRVHPTTRPTEIDPSRENAWRRIEHQREYGDVVSAIQSAMPRAIVFGDYAIDYDDERGELGEEGGSESLWSSFFLFQMINGNMGSGLRRPLAQPRVRSRSRSRSRVWTRPNRSSSGFPGRRSRWDDNDLNFLGRDDSPVPRRRRRFTRSRPADNQR